jgi:ferric iron reductase protein FhuF
MASMNLDGPPPSKPTLSGALLTDEAWLSERVEQLARQFRCSQQRTNATLWWYSASAVLLTPAIRELVTTGAAVSLAPASLRFTIGFNGYLERVIPGRTLPDDVPANRGSGGGDGESALGRHLDDALGQVIAPLARAGQATERSLWAIAADSLATVVLAAAGALPGGQSAAPPIAEAIAAASRRIRPRPRFVEVDPGAGNLRLYVRRGSCCLLIRVPEGKCIACPNQVPAERYERLVRHARAMSGVWKDE